MTTLTTTNVRNIDAIFAEERITLKEAAELFPSECGTMTVPVVVAFAVRGVRGVRLETIEGPSGVYTSREAVSHFLAAYTERAGDLVSMGIDRIPLNFLELRGAPEWASELGDAPADRAENRRLYAIAEINREAWRQVAVQAARDLNARRKDCEAGSAEAVAESSFPPSLKAGVDKLRAADLEQRARDAAEVKASRPTKRLAK